jgi:hypothetical protein
VFLVELATRPLLDQHLVYLVHLENISIHQSLLVLPVWLVNILILLWLLVPLVL